MRTAVLVGLLLVLGLGCLQASPINATLAAFTPSDGSYVPWAAARFHVILPYDDDPGLDPRPYNSSVDWRGYIDLAFAYASDMYTLKATAAAHGFAYEDALLHATANYTAGIAWSGMDQFDAFESATAKGVFLLSGGVYADKTAAAYDVTTADVAITDQLLVGYAEPFDEINVVLSTGQSGATVVWTYWNGATYSTLTLASDTTSNLTTSGKIIFTPPADWVPRVENGSKSKYWAKSTVSGGSVKPTASRIFGAPWMSSTEAAGWDATDGNRTNIGLGNLEYNPSPPAGARAKFRYQARATGTWGVNCTYGNYSAKNGSNEYLWGWYLVDILEADATGKTATTFDDFGTVTPNLAQANMDVPSSPTPAEQTTAMAQWIVTRLQTTMPGYEVDFNLASSSFDANIKSITATPPVSANHENAFHSYIMYPPTGVFDGWNAGNAHNATGTYVGFDTAGTVFEANFLKWSYWDRGDRGPMNILSMYWLGAQANITGSYNPNGYVYNETDEYYYWTASPTTLVGAITAPSTTLTSDLVAAGNWDETTISVASTAIFPADGSTFPVQIGTGTGARLFYCYMAAGALKTHSAEFAPNIASGTAVRYVGNAATRTIEVGSTSAMTAALPYSGSVIVRLGAVGAASGDIIHASVVDGSHISTTDSIANDYAGGAAVPVYWVQVGHQATDTLPSYDRVYKWGPWFPAMGVDLGNETVALNLTWKTGADVVSDPSICSATKGKCGDIARRDFANGVVFARVGYGSDPRPSVANSPLDATTATSPICIQNGDTYPACTGPYYKQLHADGTMGSLTKSFVLTGLTGIIMMLDRSQAAMPPLVAETTQSLGTTGGTTVSKDTTGGTFAIVYYSWYQDEPTLQDSVGGQSNSYTCGTARTYSLTGVRMCHAQLTHTGAGHTWSLTGVTGAFIAISVHVYAGTWSHQDGTENYGGTAGSSVTVGNSVSSGETVSFSGVGLAAYGLPWIDQNYVRASWQDLMAGRSEGIAVAYSYLPTGGTSNPTWKSLSNVLVATVDAFSVSYTAPRANALSANPWPTSPLWTPEQMGASLVTQRFDASTLGLGNGASVSSWPDSSGGGYTATPANAGICTGGSPTFQVAQQNGLGIVRLSGTQCFTTAYTGTGTAGVFAVAKLTGGGATNSLASQDTSEAGTQVYGWSLYPLKSGTSSFCRGAATEVNGTCVLHSTVMGQFNDPMAGRYSLMAGTATADGSSMYVDGIHAASMTATATNRALSSFSLGAEFFAHNLANPITGDFAEVITTNALTAIQRDQVTKYLSSKWFLAPPQTYEFASFRQVDADIILDITTSADGATWTASPSNYFMGAGGLYRKSPVRDASMALINGTWYMIHTYGPDNFQLAKSADRGLWQYVGAISAVPGEFTPLAGQAPEWFIDEDGSVHVLLSMAAQVSPVCPIYTYETHPLTEDLRTWSTPVRLTTDDTCTIDPFLLKIGGTYYLFVVQKHDGTATKLLTASSLLGPYTTASGATAQLVALGANEGPSVFRMDGKWRLYWDPGSGGMKYSDCAGNPATCTWTAEQSATMPYTSLHGTAIRNPGNPAGILGF